MTSLLGVRSLLAGVLLAIPLSLAQPVPQAQYVGSQVCQGCHGAVYERWSQTRMANIVQDPAERPEAVLGDFTTPNELVTFSLDDVDFTYGSGWKQRYFTKRGDDYYVFPAQWDVRNQVWRRYDPSGEWWAEFYPADQMQRPTGPLCDGCHSTNYNIDTKTVTEWNVGCEKCHGPGSNHVRQPSAANIVNPAKLDYVRGNDICIQCHSQGKPPANPINDQYYDWPVGFQPGERLRDYWDLEEHTLGEETSTHFPDGSAHKNRMQGNDFVQSVMYERGVRCYSCHDVHGTDNNADTLRAGNSLCLNCHGPQSPAGPRGTSDRAYSTCRRQRRVGMHGVPHAGDRQDHRGCKCPQPYVPVPAAAVDLRQRHAELLHLLPYRGDSGVGGRAAPAVAEYVPLARRALAAGHWVIQIPFS